MSLVKLYSFFNFLCICLCCCCCCTCFFLLNLFTKSLMCLPITALACCVAVPKKDKIDEKGE